MKQLFYIIAGIDRLAEKHGNFGDSNIIKNVRLLLN